MTPLAMAKGVLSGWSSTWAALTLMGYSPASTSYLGSSVHMPSCFSTSMVATSRLRV